MKRLRRNVRPIWPNHSAAIKKKPTEVSRFFEGLEDRAAEPLSEIDSAFGPVIEGEVNAKSTPMLGAHDRWQRHLCTLLERRDPIERFSFLHVRPIHLKRRAMQDRPLANKPQRRSGLDVAHKHFTAEVELALLALMFSVKMGGFVLLVKHPNDDSEEDRDYRHGPQYSVVSKLRVAAARRPSIEPFSVLKLSCFECWWFRGLTFQMSRAPATAMMARMVGRVGSI